jgi:hypothetical protein
VKYLRNQKILIRKFLYRFHKTLLNLLSRIHIHSAPVMYSLIQSSHIQEISLEVSVVEDLQQIYFRTIFILCPSCVLRGCLFHIYCFDYRENIRRKLKFGSSLVRVSHNWTIVFSPEFIHSHYTSLTVPQIPYKGETRNAYQVLARNCNC